MVRLTADLVLRSSQCLNPLKERELMLRGNKIPAIENLAATMDGFDTIDLSDNEIRRLDNFPRMKRLSALFMNNNHLVRIGADVGESLPNLRTLMLTGNKITNLFELDPLGKMPKLTMLSLIGNPVSRQPHYRLYVISTIPSLKTLDFRKIKAKDRVEANKMFANKPKLDRADQKGSSLPSRVTESSQKLTAEEQMVIKLAISKAKTNEDVDRLERMLLQGVTAAQLASLKATVFGKDIVNVSFGAPPSKPSSTVMEVEESAHAAAAEKAPAPAPVVEEAPAPAPAAKKTKVAVEDTPAKEVSALAPVVEKKKKVTTKKKKKMTDPVPAPEAASPSLEPPSEDTAMEVEEVAPAPANNEEKTPFNWSKLKVVDLKKEAGKRDLSIAGKKADLVSRLTEDDPYNEK